MTSPLRDLRGVNFGFQGKALFENLSLVWGDENPAIILGPSGCGKTTLLRILAGLLDFDGAAPRAADAPAFVFQESRLLPWFTALENIMLPLKGLMPRGEAADRARRFLKLVALDDRAAAYPGELSGGQRRRVSIARGFAFPAPALFMDEPYQSLDIPLRIELMDLTLSLIRQEPGRRVVLVTHDPREAVYMGERILILGKPPRGIVFDEPIRLSRQERAFGAPEHGILEARLLAALRPLSTT
jgi:NitT/TauT family transport system ATP-binding protein